MLYVSDDSRLSNPFNLSEGKDVGKAADGAIKGIEETGPSSRTSCYEGARISNALPLSS